MGPAFWHVSMGTGARTRPRVKVRHTCYNNDNDNDNDDNDDDDDDDDNNNNSNIFYLICEFLNVFSWPFHMNMIPDSFFITE